MGTSPRATELGHRRLPPRSSAGSGARRPRPAPRSPARRRGRQDGPRSAPAAGASRAPPSRTVGRGHRPSPRGRAPGRGSAARARACRARGQDPLHDIACSESQFRRAGACPPPRARRQSFAKHKWVTGPSPETPRRGRRARARARPPGRVSTTSVEIPRMVRVAGTTMISFKESMIPSRVRSRTGRRLSGLANVYQRISPRRIHALPAL